MIRHATLIRTGRGDQGTFGRLILDDGWRCVTGELPWRENEQGVSCIPLGTYAALVTVTPRHGSVYRLGGVPHRSGILIHPANFMGDAERGFDSQLKGCIALGFSRVNLVNSHGLLQMAVTSSRAAVTEFMRRLAGVQLSLTITEELEAI